MGIIKNRTTYNQELFTPVASRHLRALTPKETALPYEKTLEERAR